VIKKPNLFDFATSELSQDAFICWLLSWAQLELKSIDPALYDCSIKFIQSLLSTHNVKATKIRSIEVRRQDKNIDVLCVINNQYYLLIEDKTNTNQHSNQLQRYIEEVMGRGIENQFILPIYLKTNEQSHYTEVIAQGYQPFLRDDFIRILNCYEGNNAILTDFRERMERITNQVESFKTKPSADWCRFAWTGFFQNLKHHLQTGEWKYVANKKGGFLGFFWCWRSYEDCQLYLQLEQDCLCVKIKVHKKEARKSLRHSWSKQTIAAGIQQGINLKKPNRFGSGHFMTVSILENYRIFDDDRLNIDKTLAQLNQVEKLIKSL
jgi:hypothetical protein